jgi:hypothetical protein
MTNNIWTKLQSGDAGIVRMCRCTEKRSEELLPKWPRALAARARQATFHGKRPEPTARVNCFLGNTLAVGLKWKPHKTCQCHWLIHDLEVDVSLEVPQLPLSI